MRIIIVNISKSHPVKNIPLKEDPFFMQAGYPFTGMFFSQITQT